MNTPRFPKIKTKKDKQIQELADVLMHVHHYIVSPPNGEIQTDYVEGCMDDMMKILEKLGVEGSMKYWRPELFIWL